MIPAIKQVVIAGLDPAIHRARRKFKNFDPRVKPEGDELKMRRAL